VIDTAAAQRHGSAGLSVCAVVRFGKDGDIIPLVFLIRNGVPNPSRGLADVTTNHHLILLNGSTDMPLTQRPYTPPTRHGAMRSPRNGMKLVREH
jgi:hypothetical protein